MAIAYAVTTLVRTSNWQNFPLFQNFWCDARGQFVKLPVQTIKLIEMAVKLATA